MKYCFIDKSSFIDSYVSYNSSINASKLFQNQLVEVDRYLLKEKSEFYFRAPDLLNRVKIYQVKSGSFKVYKDSKVFSEGDMIVLNAGDDYLHIEVLSHLEVLLFSFGEPSYNQSKDNVHAVMDLMKEIQKKDEYTNQHCLDVSRLIKKVSVELGFSDKSIFDLVYAARYHDIGKIKVSDEILNKKGPLTDEEYGEMKNHVLYSYPYIVKYFGNTIADIAIEHHERLDGSGYPYGLKDKEISPQGKLLAVIDTFDAMTTDRIYKKGMTQEEAIKELYSLAHRYYDFSSIQALEKVLQSSHSNAE